MQVTRAQIFRRGMTHRCPNCGEATLFPPGKFFELNPGCAHCGYRFDTDEGGFLGALALNYGVTAFVIVVPTIVVAYSFEQSGATIAGLALSAALLAPILLYRASRSWWLMCDALFSPEELPHNREVSGQPHAPPV
ncbi:MAG TPA: DUF983 domain-containing protein [Lacunisphaera sp.]|nr:DUF983 domain-containing protein [Lacunisphaera sp.]